MCFKGLIFYKNKIEINYPYPYETHYEQDWFPKIHVDGIVVSEWKSLLYENYNYFDFCPQSA